ncbi:uncharacterized protein T551_01534 [Pneumocystis jirovecii RU7]|uniref:Uncharacterized protein n=1 Tax=Pneumocystis jirovecii (strain RU7) TaxID=1408657 RepID=A0A0W4ZRI8_PNEJ7|nr:uncharacterized protein T551_01534 [Pneumocystis jirovecii RU7]KTW30982.1 hypothetical protein T551_01534 [Pneumocystis jirovecii RU7]
MKSLSTPPPLYPQLPPTPPTPLHGSLYDDLIIDKNKQEYTEEKPLCIEKQYKKSEDSFFTPKTPYNILKKKNEVLDVWKPGFFPRKRPKEEEELWEDDSEGAKMFFYDERNPFFSKTKNIYDSTKEPIKKSNEPHTPEGLSFVFRGKKVIRPFEGEINDLKPRKLFQEVMSSLGATLDEVEDEFTPMKRKRRKNNVQMQNKS